MTRRDTHDIAQLIELLSAAEGGERSAARDQLQRRPDAVGALTLALRDGPERAWPAVVDVLAHLGGDEAHRALLSLLASDVTKLDGPAFDAWDHAAMALAMQRNPAIIDPLLRALSDQSGGGLIDVAESVANALAALGDERAVPGLVAALEESTLPPVDARLRRALRAIGTPAAIEAAEASETARRDQSRAHARAVSSLPPNERERRERETAATLRKKLRDRHEGHGPEEMR
jgi:HEAT repeat protein